jgi:hypothetical protein
VNEYEYQERPRTKGRLKQLNKSLRRSNRSKPKSEFIARVAGKDQLRGPLL